MFTLQMKKIYFQEYLDITGEIYFKPIVSLDKYISISSLSD